MTDAVERVAVPDWLEAIYFKTGVSVPTVPGWLQDIYDKTGIGTECTEETEIQH